jgi:RNA polymerase sigma factor (sigma-70 family)
MPPTTTAAQAKAAAPLSLVNGARDDLNSQLLLRVGQQQDKQAFAELFRIYAPLIKGFAVSHANAKFPADAAEELVQEVMFKVWLKAESFEPSKSSANTWVYTVMRNCRIDLLRRNSRRYFGESAMDIDDIWDEADDNLPLVYLQQSRNESLVADSFSTLPDEQRQALTYVYMHGKSHSEIAEETGLPLGTVKSRVRMGLKKLQQLLKTGEVL